MAKQALGKGLGALIGGSNIAKMANSKIIDEEKIITSNNNELQPEGEKRLVLEVDTKKLEACSFQPRKNFNEEHINELKESIKNHGIIQPLVVRQKNDKFEIVAGERRFRAAKELNLKTVPIILKNAEDKDVLEMMLIENLQREDLNAIEEANAFARLASDFNMTQQQIANKIGRSRASIANTLRLLDLHPKIQSYIDTEKITVGHAKVILAIKDKDVQLKATEVIIEKKLTVRDAEKMIVKFLYAKQGGKSINDTHEKSSENEENSILNSSLNKIQDRLRDHLSTNVKVFYGKDKGRIVIDYYSQDDLDRLLEIIGAIEEI